MLANRLPYFTSTEFEIPDENNQTERGGLRRVGTAEFQAEDELDRAISPINSERRNHV